MNFVTINFDFTIIDSFAVNGFTFADDFLFAINDFSITNICTVLFAVINFSFASIDDFSIDSFTFIIRFVSATKVSCNFQC